MINDSLIKLLDAENAHVPDFNYLIVYRTTTIQLFKHHYLFLNDTS